MRRLAVRKIATIGIVASALPLSLEFGSSSEKPMQLVFSDLLFFLLPFSFLSSLHVRGNEWRRVLQSSLFAVLYLVIIGGVGTVAGNGNLTPFLSSLRLAKPFLLAFVAVYVFDGTKLTAVAKHYRWAAYLVLCTVFASDVLLNGSFPNCRWGGKFLGLDVFGFPNSSTFFLVILSVLAFPAGRLSSLEKAFGWGVCSLATLWILLSLSRNGVLSLFLVSLIAIGSWLSKGRSKVLTGIIIGTLSILFLALFLSSSEALPFIPTEGIVLRIDRTLENEDPSSGRFGLWKDTLALIWKKPFLGYLFEPFSNYSVDFATPHSQYLEVCYKAGIAGLVAFCLPFVLIFIAARRVVTVNSEEQTFIFKITSILIVTAVSNFFQPNLSYSVTANLVCLLGGSLAVATRYAGPPDSMVKRTKNKANR